jgi:hypothetical protein
VFRPKPSCGTESESRGLQGDLKAWSVQKIGTLTIAQIIALTNEMYSCAEQEKKHEKKMRAYLDEFYRTRSELADRSFDFIARHDLQRCKSRAAELTQTAERL